MATENIRVVLPGLHDNYDPSSIWVTDQWFVLQNLGITLVESTNSGFVGRAAKKWTLANNNKDLEIELRDGLKFSNGDPITAEHVGKTFKRLILKNSLGYHLANYFKQGSELKSINDSLEGITVSGKNKVKFSFVKPFPNILYFLSRVETQILHENQLVQSETIGAKDWKITSGPFSMEKSENNLTLIPNKYSHEGKGLANIKISIESMGLEQGFHEMDEGNIDVLNFGAVFDPKFKKFEDSSEIRYLDMDQNSSCYFQFHHRGIGKFSQNERKAFDALIRRLDWRPYESSIFSKSNQIFTPTMPFRNSNMETPESLNKVAIESLKRKEIRLFYPDFFGKKYKKKLKENFEKLGLTVKIQEVHISKFMSHFNSDDWDILFTMMEMTPGDPRSLFVQIFSDGGMKLADPSNVGKHYVEKVFTSESEIESETKKLLDYISKQILITPLFYTKWPYYMKKNISIGDLKSYDLDFKLWKIRRTN